MAQFDKYLIAPQEVGLQLNVKPWLIANDAYERLDNCYAFRWNNKKKIWRIFDGYRRANWLR